MPTLPSPVELAQALVRLNTMNPPGSEAAAAHLVGDLLEAAGFDLAYHEFARERVSLVARLKGSGDRLPLCMTGHLDTVPLGSAPWSRDALAGEIEGGFLHGRGSCDMKSGCAAMTVAGLELAGLAGGQAGRLKGGLLLVYTAAEETGSQGAAHLAASGLLAGGAGAMLVAEPTGNRPVLGHKGAFWLTCSTKGKSAHGSMPQEGINAIYPAARAVVALERLFDDELADPSMGRPTVNVGTLSGGTKINMVPDQATFEVDLRTVPGLEHDALLARVKGLLGTGVAVEILQDLPFVATGEDDPWVARLLALARERLGGGQPGYLNYFTDASILKSALGGPPTVILGPGEATQAHQTDERCPVAQIEQAAEFYTALARDWCGV
jgi:succinyl-diaminopimelate desuccinylase